MIIMIHYQGFSGAIRHLPASNVACRIETTPVLEGKTQLLNTFIEKLEKWQGKPLQKKVVPLWLEHYCKITCRPGS